MARTQLTVAVVDGRADDRRFVRFPYHLLRGDRHWVAPLRTMEHRRWSPAHNASLRTRWVRRFLATRDGRTVGRIAAIIDEGFAARWSPTAGLFGFFDCEDDAEAARGLVEAAEGALRDQGATRAIGPVNLSTHEEVGLLVNGFESPPMLLTPHNPPYYVRLLTSQRYETEAEYLSFLWTPHSTRSRAAERIVASTSLAAKADGAVVTRPLDGRRWDDEIRTLHALYNLAFAGVWGFVPMTVPEFLERAESFRPFYKPELTVIAEVNGTAAGFGLVLPDINEVLARMDGRLFPLGWWRLMRDVPRIATGRCILLGVSPGFTGRGVAVLIGAALERAVRALGFQRVELSLVNASNRPVRHVIDAFGGTPIKVFRLYARTL